MILLLFEKTNGAISYVSVFSVKFVTCYFLFRPSSYKKDNTHFDMEKGNKLEMNPHSDPGLVEDKGKKTSSNLKNLSSFETKTSTFCTETTREVSHHDVTNDLVRSQPSLMLASNELFQAVQAKYSRFGGMGAAKTLHSRHMSIS